MKEFIEELKYNQNINFEKGLENRVDIDYVIERLEDIFENEVNVSPYFKTSKSEIETAIEDIANDDLWMTDSKAMEKLEHLTEEDINRLAWKVSDEDCWSDVYDCARDYVLEEITKEDAR